VYNAELAPKEIRGRLVGFQQLMIDIGLLTSAWLDYGTAYIDSDWSWRIPYLIQIIPAIVLALCPFLLPRSPRWLIEKGRKEEALEVLAKVHGKGDKNHPYVRQEFNEINDNVELENNIAVKSYFEMVKDPQNRRVLWIGCSVAIFQQLTGANVIMYYAAFMFQQAGLKGSLSLLANGIDCKISKDPSLKSIREN
jgi:MFS family permease